MTIIFDFYLVEVQSVFREIKNMLNLTKRPLNISSPQNFKFDNFDNESLSNFTELFNIRL